MKTTYLMPLLAALALTAGTATAQVSTQAADGYDQMQGRGQGRMQGNPKEMAQRQSQRMTKALDLTADQTAKVQQILLVRGQEMQAMRSQAQGGGNRTQLRKQMQANRTTSKEQFKAVLTPEQYTKFSAMQADRMEKGQDMENTKPKAKNDKVKIKKSEG